MGDVFEDFDRVVDTFFKPALDRGYSFNPECDITETKDHFLLSFDVPGIKKEEIKIEIEGNRLVVSGERIRDVKHQEGEASLRHERSYGRFERAFTLPNSVNSEKIEAHYENGVLNVALPKAEVAKARTVQIQTDQSDGFLGRFLNRKDETKLKDVKVN
jgi:HSP20 family protein